MCWAAAVWQRVRHVIDRGCGDRVSLVAKKPHHGTNSSAGSSSRRYSTGLLTFQLSPETGLSMSAEYGQQQYVLVGLRLRHPEARRLVDKGPGLQDAPPCSAASEVPRRSSGGSRTAPWSRRARQCSVKERHLILSRIVRHVLQLHTPGFTTAAKSDAASSSRSNDADSTSTTTATTGMPSPPDTWTSTFGVRVLRPQILRRHGRLVSAATVTDPR